MTLSFMTAFFPFCMIFAAVSDIMTMTIPNRVCLLLAAGFPLAALISGMNSGEILIFVVFGITVFFIAFALFALNLFGGGDAKLLAATALWIGPGDILPYLLVATLVGAVLAVGLLLIRATVLPVTGYAFADRLLTKDAGVPYGVALAIGGLYVYSYGPFMDAALRF